MNSLHLRLTGLLAALVIIALAGCVRPHTPGAQRAGRNANSLEVRCFLGGYGIDFFEQAAREYEEAHPGVEIDLQGDPRIWEQLRPRFVAGAPPDLAYPGWGMDHYALIYDEQIIPWDSYLDDQMEDGRPWRESFKPEILEMGVYQGKVYLMPFFISLNGWWYNVEMFRENGWEPPRTYAELLVLGEKIKAKGIAPLTFQGQYPYYAVRGFLFPWAISLGGLEVFRDAQNLKPGAWNSPAMVKAAEMLDELRRRGLLQKGAIAMSHTEAQMEFVQGHAAMVPCGTWLHSEMKTTLPPGFEMAYFLPPSAPNPQGDPSIVEIGVEPWIITRASPNPDLAADFFRYMTSLPKAKQFVREKGTLMALEGSDQTELPPHLIGPAAVLRDAKATWTPLYAKWYPDLETELRNAVNALMQGNITPRECMDRVERKAQETRDDPNIPKLVAK